MERLLRLLPAAHGEAVRLGLLAGALSTESVSERQGERARALGVGKQTAPKPSWKESEDRERAGSHALKQACPFLHQDFISKCSVFHHPPPPPAHHSLPVPALARRRVVVCRPQPAASASE